jgi:hypothetical protein
MAQGRRPANPLKKSQFSRCVNLIGLDRAPQYSRAIEIEPEGRGVLDPPLSRGMATVDVERTRAQAFSPSPRSSRGRACDEAREVSGLHWVLAEARYDLMPNVC